jgi:hypothetical protein
MPSTYSPSLRLELIGSGEQSGTWGTTTNTNLGTLLEQSIVGVQDITMFDVNYTLSNFNGVSDEARKAVLVVSGTNTAARDIIAPLVAKTYTIKNNTTGGFAINIKAATGSSVSISNGATSIVYCDGTNFNLAVNQTAVAAGTGISIATVGATNTVSIDSTVATLTGTQTLTNKTLTSPTLTAPNLGTPTVLVGTNITGTAAGLSIGGNAATVTTNANLTGAVTSVGNATTVVTNANLTGMVTSVGNAASLGSFTSANLATALTDETGSGSAVFATSPTLVTPALGTPSALVGTNITGTASGLTAGNVTTNANLTGSVTSVGNATTVVTNANLTGDVTSVGNATTVVTNANLTGGVTSVGNATTVVTNANLSGAVTSSGSNVTSLGSFTSAQLATALTNETGSGSAVFGTSPTLNYPTLASPIISGTPIGVGVLTDFPAQGLSPNSAVNFTGIPSWVKRITVTYTGLSTNGTAPPLIQLGYGATTYLTSGYDGATDMFQSSPSASLISAGINLTGNSAVAADTYQGCLTLTLMSNEWVGTLLGSQTNVARLCFTSSSISMPSLLTAIRFYINGTQIFDGGYANVMYE